MTTEQQLTEARAILHSLLVKTTIEDFARKLRDHSCSSIHCPVTRARQLLLRGPLTDAERTAVIKRLPANADVPVVEMVTELPALETETDKSQANVYAHRLACVLWSKHYRAAAPDWKPFDDTFGLLTQIDNMVAGLVPATTQNSETRQEANDAPAGGSPQPDDASGAETTTPVAPSPEAPDVPQPSTEEQTAPAPEPSTHTPEAAQTEAPSDTGEAPVNTPDTGGTPEAVPATDLDLPAAAAPAIESAPEAAPAPAKKGRRSQGAKPGTTPETSLV